MPSPFTSATVTDRGSQASGESCLCLEGAVAIAQQHADRVAAGIGDNEVGYAVAS